MAKIAIKKRTLPEWLAIFLFLYPFALGCLQQMLKLPSFVKYLMDAAWFALVVLTLIREKLYINRSLLPFIRLIGLFLVYTLFVYLFRYQSGLYYLWGFRNNFRYYAAFLAFAMYLRERDAAALVKLADKLFWVNAAATFFQFFVLGYRQDYLGGLFGVGRGCNGASVIFFVFVISKSLLAYMNGQERALNCFMKSAVALVIAAMAEIKMFFVLYAIILAMAAFYTKFSLRKFWMIFAAVLLMMMGSTLLVEIFGSSMQLSFRRIVELITSKSYATGKDLGRFTVIPELSRRILTDWPSRLFGLGLGNCDTSAFAILNTPFFRKYEYLHYTWFTSACLYLETGFIGLGMYLLFFAISYLHAYKQAKTESGNLLFCQTAMIMSVACVILTFYNSSLRIEAGYIAYFVLALPLAGRNRR